MARQQPAVVVIVRHGARLDAADKGWHLTSPTPYDPPLTYGGWVQSRALGLRIASLLNKRGTEAATDDAAARSRNSSLADSGLELEVHDLSSKPSAGAGKKTRRKHKVIIHSSPFQRCVQTSVGISAGLSQYQNVSANGRKGSDTRVKSASHLHSASPRLHAAAAAGSPKLEPIAEPRHPRPRDEVRRALREQKRQEKATLRVDAFLGEWLSPDYFEMITPPPNSTLMVAGAKADLLRRGDAIDVYNPARTPKLPGSLWGTHTGPGHQQPVSTTSDAIDSAKSNVRVLPKRDRASSYGSVGSSSSHRSDGRSSPFRPTEPNSPPKTNQSSTLGYNPPAPTYAVSPVDPIPRGYVAHARDACLDVDYQWDSMREPHFWGDGGIFGEEWSAMHKRFRRGLENMLEWYGENHGVLHTDDHEAVPEVSHSEEDGEEEEETELVLVLVTHGAGCNALIGALTNQPVLLDVGMASLTMATRKPDAPALSLAGLTSSSASSPAPGTPDVPDRPRPPHRRSSVDLGLSSIYDMKIVASSEHLRPGVDPSVTTNPTPSSPALASQSVPDYRRRMGASVHAAAGAPIASNWDLGEPAHPPARPHHPALGSIRRPSQATGIQPIRSYSISSTPQQARPTVESPNMSSAAGLWSPVIGKPASPGEETGLDFPDPSPSSLSNTTEGAVKSPDGDVSPAHTNGTSTPEEVADKLAEEAEKENAVSDLPLVSSDVPKGLGRSLSQKGLWGSAPSGARTEREKGMPKRRWTMQQEQ
ncbi:hypothetical protein MBLNU459_g0127t1 [Dothideomycetes sp. NU459]